jgi:hypothetical protein
LGGGRRCGGTGQGRVHTDVARCLDKVRMMEAFGGVFPCLRVVWQDDVHRA